MRREYIIGLTALLFYVEARPAFAAQYCRDDQTVTVSDILNMGDKELLELWCDTGDKWNYHMDQLLAMPIRGSEGSKRLLKNEVDNCEYLKNKLDAAIKPRIDKGRYNKYTKSELKCLNK